MNLVPTLAALVNDSFMHNFWKKHCENQFILDCQNEQGAIYHNGVRIVWDETLPEKSK